MATPTYTSLQTPEENLRSLLAAQKDDGATAAAPNGQEPISILQAKAAFNADQKAGAGGSAATALQEHIDNPTGAHPASAISATPTGGLAGPDVQAQLGELAILDNIAPGRGPLARSIVGTMASAGTFANGLSDGTDTSETSKLRHYFSANCASLQFVYWNGGTVNITVRAGAETSGGTVVPVFFRGSRTVIIEPGAIVVSDPIPLWGKAGDYVASRNYVEVANAGEKWMRVHLNGYQHPGEGAIAGVDYSLSGTITQQFVNVFAPILVLGSNPTPTPTIGLLGDSIGRGQGAGLVTAGWFLNALGGDSSGSLYQKINMALSGQTAGAWVSSVTSRSISGQIVSSLSSVMNQLGVNDIINDGTDLPTTQARLIALWEMLRVAGVSRVSQTTITPRTTSTDSWATVGNQTVFNAGHETVRSDLNIWLRAGAPMLAGVAVAVGTPDAQVVGDVGHPLDWVFDLTSAVESSENSGLWKAGYTGDGLHPNSTGRDAIRDALIPLRENLIQ